MNNKIEMKMKKNQLTMLVLFATMLGFKIGRAHV